MDEFSLIKSVAKLLNSDLSKFTPEQRLEIFQEVIGDYCTYCGAFAPHGCYCMRDD